MPRATLAQVGRKAIEDETFFNALVKNPEGALRKVHLTLPPAALKELKNILDTGKVTLEVNLDELLGEIHHLHVQPWPAKGTAWKGPVPGPGAIDLRSNVKGRHRITG